MAFLETIERVLRRGLILGTLFFIAVLANFLWQPKANQELAVIAALAALGMSKWPVGEICFALALSLGARFVLDNLFFRRLFLEFFEHLPFDLPPQRLSLWQEGLIPLGLGMTAMFFYSLGKGQRVYYHGRRFIKNIKAEGDFILGRCLRDKGWRRLLLEWKVLTISPAVRPGHVLTLGSTGSGKTQFLFSQAIQDMKRGIPVVFVEFKGNKKDYEMFRLLAREAGREKDLLYFNVADPQSMKFNPIHLAKCDRDSVTLGNLVVRAIGREPILGKDSEHYQALDLAKVEDAAALFLMTGKAFTLEDFYHYFSSEPARNKVFTLAGDGRLEEEVRARLEENKTDNSALTSHLRPWVKGEIARAINANNPEITIEGIFKENKLALISFPFGKYRIQAQRFGRMILAQILLYAQQRQSQGGGNPASVYLDEIGKYPNEDLTALLTTAREADVWITVACQNLYQLKNVPDADPDAFIADVISCTRTKVIFDAPHPGEAELFAKMMGTETTERKTWQSTSGLFGRSTGLENVRLTEEFIIHPNLLKEMKPFRAAVITAGQKPALIATPQLYLAFQGARLNAVASPEAAENKIEGLNLREAACGARSNGKLQVL